MVMTLVRPVAIGAAAVMLLQSATLVPYRDPAGRFSFSYPQAFGATSRGTNDGFGDRVSAVRFSSFPARFGGEAVLTRGFPLVDLQAAGGLYDSLTLEIFPAPLRQVVVGQLPRLTAMNFCGALAQTSHLDVTLPAFASVPPQQRTAIQETDRLRNTDPRIVACVAKGDTVTFDKERAFAPGFPAQHVYGAVRFLNGPFSTFQLIAGGEQPLPTNLSAIEAVVASFKLD
jgi:hypothetical protein